MRALIALLAVLVVAVPASAQPAMRATTARYQRVYVANKECRGHTFRPEKITLACGDNNLYATEVHFFTETSQAYGAREAGASATIHENNCKPDCASGKFFSDKGALTLKRIVRCRDGRLYYSRAEYAFPEGQNVVDIEPSERCSVVRTARKASRPQGRAPVGAVAQSEAPVSPSARAVIAARSAESALKLAALPKGATRLRGGVPAKERKLLGSVQTPVAALGSEEQAKLVQRSAIWVTSTPPKQLFAYVASRLPRGTREELSSSGDVSFTPPKGHETLPEIEKREAVNDVPVDEAAGGRVKSCPAEGVGERHRVLFLTFREQEQGPVLATFEDDPSACEPTPSITVPGHPPVALSEAQGLIPKIEKTIGSPLKGL
jgi:hypothetical protein